MSEEEIIIVNMLIHGHDTDIKLVELEEFGFDNMYQFVNRIEKDKD